MLVLVRHGETAWNREHRVLGHAMDVPLTELGFAQARRAASVVLQALGERRPTVWSSDQLRARQTAEVVAGALGVPLRADALLREQFLGAMEGRLSAELRAEPVPDGVHIAEVRWAGGESVQDVWERCARFARERLDGPDAVIVGHGMALAVLQAVLSGRSHREVDWGAQLPLGGVRILP